MTNPYRGIPDHQMWRRAVSRVEPHRIDPAVNPLSHMWLGTPNNNLLL